ncbi:hypothetical protein PoMZ_12827 [Pyricularia oryzae]|uniref:Uncharacterized protein n=1 Tax=Pyricularia oryzae TaxID=318829 RepID=A0A4P7NTV1_PYROR|nr:hypothetical protein PoMZ_12827 [Pyricularia oryzae]
MHMAARVLKLHDMWVPLPGSSTKKTLLSTIRNLSFLEFRLVKSRQVLGYLKYPENLSLENRAARLYVTSLRIKGKTADISTESVPSFLCFYILHRPHSVPPYVSDMRSAYDDR